MMGNHTDNANAVGDLIELGPSEICIDIVSGKVSPFFDAEIFAGVPVLDQRLTGKDVPKGIGLRH